jgi:hypothetical protein
MNRAGQWIAPPVALILGRSVAGSRTKHFRTSGDEQPMNIYDQIKDPEQLKKLQGEKKEEDVMRRDE